MSVPEYAELPAPPPLDTLIHCFWFLRGSFAGAPPQPVLPDGRMEIVLHLAEPFAEVGPDGVARGQAEALLAGQLTAPITLIPRGPADVVGIRFRTVAARSLLGFSGEAVTGRVEPLARFHAMLAGALLGATARRHDPRTPRRNEEIVGALSAVLLPFVGGEPSPMVRETVRALARPCGAPLRELAANLGVTLRTLERRVKEHTGLGPKPLQRVLRFRNALRLLEETPWGDWSGAAIRAGYYDQPHLIREFRGFAGMPPKTYFQAEMPLSRAILGR